jgi:hypothetical protein
MGHRLRMSAEIGHWLADLRSSQLGVAAEVGAALAAVMDSDNVAGLAFVTDLGTLEAVQPGDRVAAVDAAYQDLLASLQLLRQQAAEAGSLAATSRGRISAAGVRPSAWTDHEIAQARQREAELTARSQRCQRDIDAFRARKEAAKASYTAASASRDIQRAIIKSGEAIDQAGLQLGVQPEAAEAEADLAAAERALSAASGELRDLLAQAAMVRQRLLSGLSNDGSTPDSEPGPPAGLLELRVCPFAADVRLLCAVEPAGTLTLLAVLEGEPVISSLLARAIGLAGELLAEIRSDGWPAEIGEVAFADTATFLHKSFPHLGSYISARSAELAAANTIAGLRRRRGLSLADIAAATGLSESALWKLETTDLRSARIDDVAGYVQALGGHLELTAVADHGAPDGSAAIILY